MIVLKQAHEKLSLLSCYNFSAPNTNESLLESANMGFQRYYNETIGIRLSQRSPLFRQQRRRYDLPTIPMHGVLPNPPYGVAVPPQASFQNFQFHRVFLDIK